MASIMALRALLGTSLGLGTADLVWINVALGPAIVEPEAAPIVERAAVTSVVEPTPAKLSLPAESVVTTPSPEPQVIDASFDVAAAATPAFERVYFPSTNTELDAPAAKILARVVAEAGSDSVIVLEGHADFRGSETFNRALSQQRAVVVGAYLERLGLARSRIRVNYVGEDKEVASAELWRDRRVDIQIVKGER